MADNSGSKQRGKPFQPGQSGNPAGKPKGARNHATRALETLLGNSAEDVALAVIKAAEGGDTSAARLVLERVLPARKDAPVSFELPPIKSAADTVAASSALLDAVAGGDVTPDEAGRVMALLTAHKALVEAGDLEARIAALEAKR